MYRNDMQKALTRRAGDWLARNSWPYAAMMLAFACALWTAFECSLRTSHWGGMALRFGVNFIAAYLVFLLCLTIWVWTKPILDPTTLLDGAPAAIETKDPWDDEAIDQREQFIDEARRSAQNSARGDGAQAMIGLALFAMVFGTLFVAAHMVRYARWYLGHMLVLGGKVRHRALGRIPPMSWLHAPLRQTGWAALILLVHYVLLGLLLQMAFPHAATVADAVRLAGP